MKCPHCGTEYVQVVSEYIELKEKDELPGIDSMGAWATLGIVFACFLLICSFVSMGNCAKSESLDMIISLALFIFSSVLFIKSISILNKVKLIRAFEPFKHQTNTKAICMQCGQTWYIEEDVQAKNQK